MKQQLAWVIIALWGCTLLLPMMMTLQPERIDLQGILQQPGMAHPMGQDDLGRSVLHRLLDGSRVSLLVGIGVTLLCAVIGVSVGILAGWYGGVIDHFLVRVIDVFMAFPGLLLAIVLAGILGPGLGNLVIALAAVGWVGFARLARAQTLQLREREHILAALALGSSRGVILLRHLLPLIAAPLIIEATFSVASIIIAEASLSFLGLGIQPPGASWGNMIRDGSRYLLVAPHLVLYPGLALALVVLAINTLGDALRDRLDSRLIT